MLSSKRCFFRGMLGALALICIASAQEAAAQAPPGGPPAPGAAAGPPAALLTLEEAQRLALAYNQSVRAQRLNIDQARAGQITAGLKPNPVYTMVNEDFPVFSPGDLNFANLRDSQEFLQSVSYLIERGGKRLKRLAVAQDATEVTARTVADAERQLRFQVAQAFVGVLLAKSNLQLAQDDLKDFSDVVTINQRRMAAGDISEGDYLKISLQKLQFEQDVSAAQLALVQSKAALRQLVGYQTVAENFDVVGSLDRKKYAVQLEDLEKQALQARPDLMAADSGVKLANDTVTLAYGNRARDLTSEVEYKRNGPVNGVGFGFSIDIPIHNRNQGEIARSQFAVRQAEEARAFTRNGVLTDVINAYSNFRTNDQIVTLYQSGYLNQARQSLDISKYAYDRGAASLLDLLDAERSYRATQLGFRQGLAAYMVSAEQINLVVGTQVMR
ncbi:MAG TPA: TolC family protein [Bryobacterales bacterium]|nr:TolC family protein [Bryobacterales bacterium]